MASASGSKGVVTKGATPVVTTPWSLVHPHAHKILVEIRKLPLGTGPIGINLAAVDKRLIVCVLKLLEEILHFGKQVFHPSCFNTKTDCNTNCNANREYNNT